MYTVFGYDDLCVDFKYTFNSFIEAVKVFKELNIYCITFLMREHPGTCLYIL